MTNREIIEILQYMRHDVLANSNKDTALVKAVEALSVDFSTLKPSDGDVIVAKIDVDSYTVKEMEIFYNTVRERVGDTPVIFVPKDIDFTVENKSEVISELQSIIDKLREGD